MERNENIEEMLTQHLSHPAIDKTMLRIIHPASQMQKQILNGKEYGGLVFRGRKLLIFKQAFR